MISNHCKLGSQGLVNVIGEGNNQTLVDTGVPNTIPKSDARMREMSVYLAFLGVFGMYFV